MADIVKFLAKIPLFAEVLDDEQLGLMASKCQLVSFSDKSPLTRQGDLGASMFVLVEGSASVTIIGRDGVSNAIATISTNDIVGEMSLLTGASRTATVTANRSVLAVEITKTALEEILLRAPALADRFARVLSRRQAELREAGLEAVPIREDEIARRITGFFSGGRRWKYFPDQRPSDIR